MQKKIILLLIVVCFLIGVGYYKSDSARTNTYEVTFKEKEVYPSKLKIKNGDTVIFKSDDEGVFWPASDLHPSHLVYPDFDSKAPIENGKSWSFKFLKTGTWTYHDHLNPQKRGVVVVGNAFFSDTLSRVNTFLASSFTKLYGKDKYIEKIISNCSKQGTFEENRGCWERALVSLDKNFGIDSAFDLLEKGISKDKNLAGTCHYYTEFVGFLAYERLYNGEKPTVYEKADLCGYGFYHAFLQEWISHTKDISAANNYCDNSQTGKHGKDNCILGVGLGITFSNVTFDYLKDDQVINKSLETCKKMYGLSSVESFNLCSEGVLSGLAHLYFGDHGLSLKINSNNPYWVCDTLSSYLRNRCYPAITEVVYADSNQDFERTSKFILNLKNNLYRSESFERLGTVLFNSIYFKNSEGIKTHELCRSINDIMAQRSCFVGYVRRYISINVRELQDINLKKRVCDTSDRFSEYETNICNSELNMFLKNNEQSF